MLKREKRRERVYGSKVTDKLPKFETIKIEIVTKVKKPNLPREVWTLTHSRIDWQIIKWETEEVFRSTSDNN